MRMIGVLDYGIGNIGSILNMLKKVGVKAQPFTTGEALSTYDRLILPGVGAFEACMRGLWAIQGQRIIERRLAGGRPVLGVCVGMQIMFEAGAEHGLVSPGCAQWPGRVERLDAPVLPHQLKRIAKRASDGLR